MRRSQRQTTSPQYCWKIQWKLITNRHPSLLHLFLYHHVSLQECSSRFYSSSHLSYRSHQLHAPPISFLLVSLSIIHLPLSSCPSLVHSLTYAHWKELTHIEFSLYEEEWLLLHRHASFHLRTHICLFKRNSFFLHPFSTFSNVLLFLIAN